jgi:DNA-binding response OmpR family regulator
MLNEHCAAIIAQTPKRYPLPALILLDLKLPLKHGFEVLVWLRQQPSLRGIIVIILTSSSEERDVSQAYDLGTNAYLVKPTSVDKLTEIVGALDTFWFRYNRFKLMFST